MAISPGKVEIGQGIVTALAQIAADELDVDIGRIEMIRASTAASPNEGVTSGSLSVQQSGRALRHVCAEVRQRLPRGGIASGSASMPTLLDVEDGTISGPGNVRTSYWELAGDVSLDRDADAGRHGEAAAKRARGRTFGPAASTFPTRCSRGRASFTICALPDCCTAACCGRTSRAPS